MHFQGEVVESVLGNTMPSCGLGGRSPQLHAAVCEAERLLRCRFHIDIWLGGAADHQGYLTPYLQGRPFSELPQRPAADLLIGFGELAAHCTWTISSERQRHGCQCGGSSVWGFEEDHGARLGRQLTQPLHPLGGLAWQEAFEAEPVNWEAGDSKCGKYGGWARHCGDPEAAG